MKETYDSDSHDDINKGHHLVITALNLYEM